MIGHIVVTIPAADEQDDIGECLTTIEAAIAELHAHTSLRGHVVVALDDCRDDTAAVVAGFPHVRMIECRARRVGAARRAAAAYALSEFGPADRLWLASTDADCRVPPSWLTQQAVTAAGGTDLVLGTLRLAPGLAAPVEQAWYARHDLADGHPHVHGANLAIAGAAYVRIGGWADLAVHEDTDLVERAIAAGLVITRSGANPVVTSARLTGRAPQGFASYLDGLHDEVAEAG